MDEADGDVVGKLFLDSKLFTILGTKGSYEISEIELTLNVQSPLNDAVGSGDHFKGAHFSTIKAATQPSVRVLILYGTDVPGRASVKIHTLAANILAETNSILASSGVSSSYKLQLAGVEPAGQTWKVPEHFSTLSKEQILTRMELRSGEFSTLDSRMNVLKADIAVTLFSADDSSTCPGASCAAGRVGGIAYTLQQANPFAVVADTYALGDLTGPHEIGHVLGGNHQDETRAGTQSIAHGKVVTNTWLTVMGKFVTPGCPFYTLNQLPTCPRIPRFSNADPAYTFGGQPIGDAGFADMAHAFPVDMTTVASYRAETSAVPGPLGSIGLSNVGGQVRLTWQNAPGATYTEAESGPMSNAATLPAAYSQIYSGTAKEIYVTISSLPRWYSFRARGCNSSGCGPYTQAAYLILP